MGARDVGRGSGCHHPGEGGCGCGHGLGALVFPLGASIVARDEHGATVRGRGTGRTGDTGRRRRRGPGIFYRAMGSWRRFRGLLRRMPRTQGLVKGLANYRCHPETMSTTIVGDSGDSCCGRGVGGALPGIRGGCGRVAFDPRRRSDSGATGGRRRVAGVRRRRIGDEHDDHGRGCHGPARRRGDAAQNASWCTGYGPSGDEWIVEANTKISEMAADYPERVRVADWAAIAAKRPGLLAGDRIHPGPEASKRYAEEIARALDSF